MTNRRDTVEQYLEAAGIENAVFIDGHDDALIGVAYLQYQGPFVIYDRQKIIDYWTDQFDGDSDEALEYVEFNIDAAYDGPLTPMLLTRVEDMEGA
jgi:hypothetical protein